MDEKEVPCPYCDATTSVSLPDGAVYTDAAKTRKDAEHVHEADCAMCDGHFYVHYSLN